MPLRLSALVAVLLAAILAGGALAQEEGVARDADAEVFQPAYESRSHHSRPFFPERALRRQAHGIVHLCCRAREDRTLDCSVGFETPERLRFGAASLNLVQDLRLTPASYEQLQQRPAQAFRIPIRWQVTPVPEEFHETVQRIDAETENLCGPGTGRARPEDYIVIEGTRIRR
jgi:hypothetical protein